MTEWIKNPNAKALVTAEDGAYGLTASPLPAGRDLDALIARKIFGLTVTADGGHAPRYSTEIAAAWLIVQHVQKQHPGWRFELMGGDESWGWTKGKGPEEFFVDKTVRRVFGWYARFFGDEDPTRNSGVTHCEEYAETPALAICKAVLDLPRASGSSDRE